MAFALRSIAARDPGLRASKALETYFQVTYSGGYISIGLDLTSVTRSLLVAYSLGGDMLARHKLTPQTKKTNGGFEDLELSTMRSGGQSDMSVRPLRQADGSIADHPRMRYWIRQYCGVVALLFLVTTILSAVAGSEYKRAIDSGADAALVRWLWYGARSSLKRLNEVAELMVVYVQVHKRSSGDYTAALCSWHCALGVHLHPSRPTKLSSMDRSRRNSPRTSVCAR